MKPEPPSDLWEQIAVLHAKASEVSHPARPANSFTAAEYGEKFDLTRSATTRRLQKMMRDGSIKKHPLGPETYYTIVPPARPA